MAKEELQLQEQEANSPEPNRNEDDQRIGRGQQSAPMQRGSQGVSPFSLMRRFSEDVDRLFGNFFGPSTLGWGDWSGEMGDMSFWPKIDVRHAGDKLLIQADVPGLKKEDVSVEVRDRELSISGERRSESEHKEGRFYRTERSYGSFFRTVTLPEGAKPDTASATFENG